MVIADLEAMSQERSPQHVGEERTDDESDEEAVVLIIRPVEVQDAVLEANAEDEDDQTEEDRRKPILEVHLSTPIKVDFPCIFLYHF